MNPITLEQRTQAMAGPGNSYREILAALKAVRLEALEEAKSAVVAEYLTEETGDPEDKAYDRAVSDCVDAIRRLIAD